MIKKGTFLLFLITIFSIELGAQVILPGTYFDCRDQYDQLLLDSSNFLTYHPSVISAGAAGFSILNPYARLSFNSAYPRSYNDGPVWKGKGLTQELHAGFRWKKGPVSLTLFPVVYYSQNPAFDLASVNPDQNKYNYQFGVSGGIDYVQQYGNKAFVQFHPGQSELAFNTRFFQLAVSTQNFTLGPAVYNSIIMSNSGAGFPHLRLGTPGKVALKVKDVQLGSLEANLFYGLLYESEYFDTLSNDDKRYFNGLSVGYEIPYLKGLTVGFQRVLYKDTRYFESADLYSMFYIRDDGMILSPTGDTTDTQNDTFDQLASAFIEWKLTDSDLRLYFEFARNDFNGSFRRFVTEFEHSRAYSLGLEKVFRLKSGKDMFFSYEHTFLPRYMSYQYRPEPPFYTHHVARQGYTNRGQLLGAGTGPGSVSDLVAVNWIKPAGNIGFTLQRIRFDEDYFITKIPNTLSKIGQHDIEFTGGFSFTQRRDQFFWGFNTSLSYRYNMYYETGNDVVNFAGSIFVSYVLKGQ